MAGVRHPSHLVRILLAGLLTAAVIEAQTGSVHSGSQPIPGATVTATLDSKPYTTVTAADGHFSFTGLPSGKGTVEVRMFGFDTQSKPAVLGSLGPQLDFNLQVAESPMARRIAQFGTRGVQSTDPIETQIQNELSSV